MGSVFSDDEVQACREKALTKVFKEVAGIKSQHSDPLIILDMLHKAFNLQAVECVRALENFHPVLLKTDDRKFFRENKDIQKAVLKGGLGGVFALRELNEQMKAIAALSQYANQTILDKASRRLREESTRFRVSREIYIYGCDIPPQKEISLLNSLRELSIQTVDPIGPPRAI